MSITTEANFKLFAVHKIDNTNNVALSVNIATNDIEAYTRNLFYQSLNAKNIRGYRYRSETTEIATIVNDLISNIDKDNLDVIFENYAETIAGRLLYTQGKYNERYSGLPELKKGSLVTILSKHEDTVDILISKIDQENFISLEDSLLKAGLPENKATQKSCAFTFNIVNDEYQLKEIVVTDTNPKISTFWAQDFLELTEISDDDKNTKDSFNQIEKVLLRNVNSVSKTDYTELRNSLVGYYRNNLSFNFENMVQHVIGDYEPESEKLKISKVKDALEKLRQQGKFDTAFEIKKEVIKARFKRSYKLSEQIELRTSDYIKNLKNVIIAKENGLGEKVLEIKDINEEVYQKFLRKEE
ncbi:hypothetical protein F0342_21480 [Bacillus sp. CH30_1T]|uniref:hypothetical protein n=1 Tax=Bacillus sp. CH30_1T TaxID=2604836 RepID=UPI0011ED3FB8|nr:hypothetical protein [Bacillus sp. CH30_1T]KAA0560736.1 hypothetical protein F0342_21480 [Bacillus sp. CH30_1T]